MKERSAELPQQDGHLNNEEGVNFVLRALTRYYVGCVFDPQDKPDFKLVELGPNQYYSPVFGPRQKQAF